MVRSGEEEERRSLAHVLRMFKQTIFPSPHKYNTDWHAPRPSTTPNPQIAFAAMTQPDSNIKSVYEQLAGVPFLRGAAGPSSMNFLVKAMGQLFTSTPWKEARKPKSRLRERSLARQARTLVISPSGKGSRSMKSEACEIYHYPRKQNPESIDSLMLYHDGERTSAYFFQITIGGTHALKTKGLSEAWAVLPQNT